jgi:putative FmdB family regulatory protein
LPTYEYACKDCGERLEVHQSFSDTPLTECPACHGSLRKVFGNIAITFKGSGFYKTDSRNSGKNGASKSSSSSSSSPESSSSESKSDGKSETKSEGKSESKSESKSDSSTSSSSTTAAASS